MKSSVEDNYISPGRQTTDLISVGVVGLHTTEDGLVLTKSASHIDSALMSHHGATEPGE